MALGALSLFPIGGGAVAASRAVRGIRRVRVGRFGKRWQSTRGLNKGRFIQTPASGTEISRQLYYTHKHYSGRVSRKIPFPKTRRRIRRLETYRSVLRGDWSGLAMQGMPWYIRYGFAISAATTTAGRISSTRSGIGAPSGVPNTHRNSRRKPRRVLPDPERRHPRRWCRVHRRMDRCKNHTK